MRCLSLALLAAAIALLPACNREGSGGPAEKAGKEVGRGVGQAGKAVEKAGRNMQDAAKGDKK
jgi:type IV secretory pathway TrbL component